MPSSIKIALLVFLTVFGLSVAAPIPDNNTQLGNSYSGAGGHADGGAVKNSNPNTNAPFSRLSLIKLFSSNAGDGGSSTSGSSSGSESFAVSQAQAATGNGTAPTGNTNNALGNSYSGAGGQANGGSVDDSSAPIELFSDNAGKGGNGKSGASGPLAGILVPSSKSTSTKTWRTTKFTRVVHLQLD
ncbi:unnamed protein product [Cyclocybe aegerita]|uniref:Uncharacterized protein n=1 Tax=Cyclocybe aegerita TaxID=1973307 RepID=A0A8S0XJT7_CYCAE|nr:unnamed protein product [Cyclocybe aegerita]